VEQGTPVAKRSVEIDVKNVVLKINAINRLVSPPVADTYL
jgi:hypothetical protein